VSVRASWEQGYVTMVRVRNTGKASRTWSVTVTHSDTQNITLRNTWNASGRQSGDRFTFTGASLAPGATFDFGFQASKNGRGNARPAGCTAVGGRCTVS
jgi:cellulase/cellobiase CelA1